MAVRVKRELNGGVPQALLDDLGVDALLQHQSCVRVPEIVEPSAGQLALAGELHERMSHGVGLPRRAVSVAEHQSIAVEVIAECLLLPFDLGLPGSKDSRRCGG